MPCGGGGGMPSGGGAWRGGGGPEGRCCATTVPIMQARLAARTAVVGRRAMAIGGAFGESAQGTVRPGRREREADVADASIA